MPQCAAPLSVAYLPQHPESQVWTQRLQARTDPVLAVIMGPGCRKRRL